MQSMKQKPSMNQMKSIFQMLLMDKMPEKYIVPVVLIVSFEDQDKLKNGDEEFLLKKYPLLAQFFLQQDEIFGHLKKTLEIEKNLPDEIRKSYWKGMDQLCDSYMRAPAYKNGNKKHNGHKICCEMNDYCSFYKQTWFFIVCGAVGFLLLVGIAGGVFFIIRRKNKKNGCGNPKKIGGSKP